MGSICLSLSTVLRCASLTRNQAVVVLVPIALQLLFTIGLLVCKWGTGRIHILLVAEGASVFLLSLIDFLSHMIPAAKTSLDVFKALDIFIGSMSFLPILFYIVYLYLLARSHFLPFLPRRMQTIFKFVLLVFIPVTAVSVEVGAFVGVGYRSFRGNNASTILAIGFPTLKDQVLWQFFSSLALALFTAFQAIMFCLTFFRLVQVFLNQRRMDDDSREDSAHLVRGIGWIAAGLKLGAIEAVIGFAGSDGGFGGILARRLLRMIARACLIIGVIKGMDTVENFNILGSTRLQNQRLSRIGMRFNISAPRNSTFAQLSPHATAFHAMPRATTGSALNPDNDRARRNAQRVTLHYDGNTAPKLQMRLSDLNMPSPTQIVEKLERDGRTRPLSDGSWSLVSSQRTTPRSSMPAIPTVRSGRERAGGDPFADQLAAPQRSPPRASRKSSRASMASMVSDSLDVVREIAAQFPGLPPRVTGRPRGSLLGRVTEEDPYTPALVRRDTTASSVAYEPSTADYEIVDPFSGSQNGVSRAGTGASSRSAATSYSHVPSAKSSLRRKPVPAPIDALIASPHLEGIFIARGPRAGGPSAYPSPPVSEGLARSQGAADSTPTASAAPTVTTYGHGGDPFVYDNENTSLRERGPGRIATRVAEMEVGRLATHHILPPQTQEVPYTAASHDSVDIQWPSPARHSPALTTGREVGLSDAWPAGSDPEIKSVGRVSTRRTPEPTTSSFAPASMTLERHEFEYFPDMSTSVESADRGLKLASPPRRDSETLAQY